MNIAGTEYSLQTKSFDIFISGCNRGCPGCFNPEAQRFDYGEPLDLLKLIRKITDNETIIETIRLMGGDPLEQSEKEIKHLSWALKLGYPDKKLILYTGADLAEIPQWCFELFDAIKYGRYIQELHCDNPLYGSSNQKYITKGEDY